MASISRTSVMLVAIVLQNASIAGTAQPFTDLTSISARTTVNAKSFGELSLQCKPNFSLISHVATPGRPESMVILGQQALLIDGTAPLAAGVYPEPTGVKVTAYNNFDASQTLDVQVLCGNFDAEYAGALAVGVVNVISKQFGQGVAACPQDYFVTGGGNYGPTVVPTGQHVHWQNGPPLEQRPDGPQADAADAWAAKAANPGTADQTFRAYAYCRKLSRVSLEVHVTSLLLEPQERRFAGVSVGLALIGIGSGGVSGDEAFQLGEAGWRQAKPPFAPPGFNFTSAPNEFTPGPGGILGSFVRDRRPLFSAKIAVPVTLAVIVAPTQESPPPVAIVQAIEYYNKARDHHFVTSIPQEISDLDTGVHPGWQRTGEMFNVYAAGSGGPLGRLPVCRYYGLPAAGLDSHFYTASVLECLDVGAKFAGAWQIESGEVFQIHFPNIVTGECPAGTIAVLRTWNQRADSNHRYMTKLALRAQMLAEGHISEGYGPNGVAFCAPA